MNWISIHERMPEYEVNVLVFKNKCDKENGCMVDYGVPYDVAFFDKEEKVWICQDGYRIEGDERVSHWAELHFPKEFL